MVPPNSFITLRTQLSSPKSPSLGSLAALARTHTAYQREAEEVLYQILSFFTSLESALKCMKTLATNVEKAALVRVLSMDCGLDDRVANYLSKSLINMHSLSEFWLRPSSGSSGGAMMTNLEGLGEILCGGHFRLQTLYCHDIFNISQIIKSQIELQILGLYNSSYSPEYILREFHNAHSFLPIVVILKKESFLPYADHICIFPAFYSVDRRATIHQVLAQSFRQDQGFYMGALPERVRILSIYASDMPSIYALAKNMSVSFPGIECLNLWFERRCEIPPEEIIEELSFSIPHLRRVDTYVWPTA